MMEFTEIQNPFPGLRPFELNESNLFFGREGQSDELLARLQRKRFLAVVGTSGSGKSSLVRAGLLPALYGGLMGGAGSSWRIAILRPGHDPIGNLAGALDEQQLVPKSISKGLHEFDMILDHDVSVGHALRLETKASPRPEESPMESEAPEVGVITATNPDSLFQHAIIETTLRRSTLGLVDVVRHARMSTHENLLIVVDQFEELFRFKEARKETGSEDDAAAFVKLLLEASAQDELPIYVVLTMRSDFLGDCSQFTGLPEAINQGQYLIPRMSRDERRAAITGPVAVGGGEITLPLVSRLLNDVGDNPDQLPILQHALMRTWDYCSAHRRNGEAIGIEHYEAIGTMSEALSRHADEAFDELPDERSRVIAEKLFKRLTEKGADNRETRRPTRLSEICSVAEATEDEVLAVIDVFRSQGRSFLMPPAGGEVNSETIIDISHESLIRNWTRLQAWVDDEAQSARVYRRLADDALLRYDRKTGLLDDPRLQLTLDWRSEESPTAGWAARYHDQFDLAAVFPDAKSQAERHTRLFDLAMAYLEDSRVARDAAVAESEHRRNEELKRERRERELAQRFAEEQALSARHLRRYLYAMIVVLLLALAGGGAAVYAFSRARASETRAQQKSAELEIARQQTQKLADGLKNSLEGQKAATTEAERQRGIANKSEDEALTAQKQAQAEAKRADEQARLAHQRADDAGRASLDAIIAQRNAEAAQADAEKQRQLADEQRKEAVKAKDDIIAEQKKTAAVQEANKLFREASADSKKGEEGIDDAVRKYTKAAEAFDEMKDSSARAATFVELGEILMGSESSRLEQGVESFLKATQLYEASKDYNGAAFAAARLGEFYTRPDMLGKINDVEDDATEDDLKTASIEIFQMALGYYVKAKNSEGKIATLTRLGDLSRESTVEGKRDVDFYEQTLPLFDQAKQRDRLSAMLIQIGQAYKARQNTTRADEFFERAVKTHMDAGDLAAATDTLLTLGFPSALSYYLKPEGLDKTQTYVMRAEGLWENDPKGRADALRKAGQKYLALCERFVRVRNGAQVVDFARRKAFEITTRALALFEGARDRKGQALTLVNLGSIYATSGPPRGEGVTRDKEKDGEDAREIYRKALVLFREEGESSKQMADALVKLASSTERALTRPDYDQALKYYEEAGGIYIQLRDLQSARRVGQAMDALKKRMSPAPKPTPSPPPA